MTITGIELLEQQALDGDGQACVDLYNEYRSGKNVERNNKTADIWLEMALDLNNASAQFIKGVNDLNVGNNDDAQNYLRLSASNGNADALNILAQISLNNVEGIHSDSTDIKEGIDQLIEAGEKGSVDAQVVLGKCFYQGKWVPKDLMLAKFWLQKACEKNNPEAVKLYDEVIRVKDIIL